MGATSSAQVTVAPPAVPPPAPTLPAAPTPAPPSAPPAPPETVPPTPAWLAAPVTSAGFAVSDPHPRATHGPASAPTTKAALHTTTRQTSHGGQAEASHSLVKIVAGTSPASRNH